MAFQTFGGGGINIPAPHIASAPNPMAGMSQLMQMISVMSQLQNRNTLNELNTLRLQQYQDQLENGKTDKDKARIIKNRALMDYANRIVDNPDFISEYKNVLQMSPGMREEAFKKLNDKYIEPHKYDYEEAGVKPKDVYNYLLHEQITKANNEAKEIEEDKWPSLWNSIASDFVNLRNSAASLLPGTDTRKLAQEAEDYRQKQINDSIYLKDQELRRQQGVSWWDRTDLGGKMRELLGMAPTLASFAAGGVAGAAAKAPAIASRMPSLARFITQHPAITNAAVGGTIGAGLGNLSFAQGVNASNLTEEQKQAAMNSPEHALNVGTSALFGAVAPSVMAPYRAVRGMMSSAYRPMAPAASRWTGIPRHMLDTGAGMGVMSAGQQAVNNLTLGSATNQDIPWHQGVSDAALSGVFSGLGLGAVFGGLNRPMPAAPKNAPAASANESGVPFTDNMQKPPSELSPGPEPETPKGPKPSGNGTKAQPEPTPQEPVQPKTYSPEQLEALRKNFDNFADSASATDKAIYDAVVNQNVTPDQLAPNIIHDIWRNDIQNANNVVDHHVLEAFKPVKPDKDAGNQFIKIVRMKDPEKQANKIAAYLGLGKNYDFSKVLNRREGLIRSLLDSNLTPGEKLTFAEHIDTFYNEFIQQNLKLSNADKARVISEFINPETALTAKQRVTSVQNGEAKEQSQGTGQGAVNDNSPDSQSAASARADATDLINATVNKAGTDSTAAQSGEPNGTPPQSAGTPQAYNGTSQATQTSPIGEPTGPVASNLTRSGKTPAGPRSPDAEAGTGTVDGQSAASDGRSDTTSLESLNDFEKNLLQSVDEQKAELVNAKAKYGLADNEALVNRLVADDVENYPELSKILSDHSIKLADAEKPFADLSLAEKKAFLRKEFDLIDALSSTATALQQGNISNVKRVC